MENRDPKPETRNPKPKIVASLPIDYSHRWRDRLTDDAPGAYRPPVTGGETR
jgi:hypothetical protein